MARPVSFRKRAADPDPSANPATPVPPAIVDTLDDEAPGGVTASTVKLSANETDSCPVTTFAVRGSRAAVGDTLTLAIAVTESTTVTGPSSPGGAPPRPTSPPREARVWPATQCVLLP